MGPERDTELYTAPMWGRREGLRSGFRGAEGAMEPEIKGTGGLPESLEAVGGEAAGHWV